MKGWGLKSSSIVTESYFHLMGTVFGCREGLTLELQFQVQLLCLHEFYTMMVLVLQCRACLFSGTLFKTRCTVCEHVAENRNSPIVPALKGKG